MRRLSISIVLALLTGHAALAQVTLGPEFLVNTYTRGDQSRPAVAMDPSGSFVVVWEGAAQDGGGSGIFGQRYESDGAPAGPEFLGNSITAGNQSRPSAAMDDSGRIVVVWQSQGDGSDSGIFARHFDADGGPLGVELQVNAYTSGAQVEPDVA